MKSILALALVGAALLPLATASTDPAATTSVVRSDETGTISGKVVWEGERPPAKADITFGEKESAGCQHGSEALDPKDRSVLIHESGGLANVVVMVEIDGVKPKVPAEPIVLDQHGCRFEPHVLVVPVGATLKYDNSDETNHNIHTFAKKNQPVNKNVASGTNFEQVVDKAESIEVKCDVHPWMKGYIVVTDAAYYAVTAADGSFSLEGLPPGNHKVNYWHEEAGKGKSDEVTVAAGQSAELTMKVGASKKKKKGGRRR